MKNCSNCANAVFDPLWGDYKCKVYEVIVAAEQKLDCPDHKPGTPTEGKGIETLI